MELQNKPCIVSFSSQGRENYNAAMLRLISTSKECGYDGDFLLHQFDGYVPDYRGVTIHQGRSLEYPQPNLFQCYNHQEVPYLFKLAMIQKAKEAGYTQIIWCDSTITLSKQPTELLELANKQGIVSFDNLGHPLKPWISDIALKNLGLNEVDLTVMSQIMACVILFDFSNPITQTIFDEWLKLAQDGFSFQNNSSLRDGFKAHRHDQACLSGLLYKYQVPLLPYGHLIYEPHDETKEYGDNYTFVNRGIK